MTDIARQTATAQQFFINPASGSTFGFATGVTVAPARAPRQSANVDKVLEAAVYNYIRAVRALGRTTLNTREIADALKLSLADVDGTVKRLEAKGVKIAA
jgi:hypothetical protein